MATTEIFAEPKAEAPLITAAISTVMFALFVSFRPELEGYLSDAAWLFRFLVMTGIAALVGSAVAHAGTPHRTSRVLVQCVAGGIVAGLAFYLMASIRTAWAGGLANAGEEISVVHYLANDLLPFGQAFGVTMVISTLLSPSSR